MVQVAKFAPLVEAAAASGAGWVQSAWCKSGATVVARRHAALAHVYIERTMRFPVGRLVATLLLSGQVVPVGLPLLCDQVQHATPASCDQQMASQPSGPAVAATTQAIPCANSPLCATTATAVVALGGSVSVSVGQSHSVAFGISTFAPADPQPPLPPPPQA